MIVRYSLSLKKNTTERRELVRQYLSAESVSENYKKEALQCANLACVAYQSYDNISGSLPESLVAVYKIDNSRTDTQGFISLDQKNRTAYVAFKGSWELADFMNDSDLFLGPFSDKPPLRAQAKMVDCWNSVKDGIIGQLIKQLNGKSSQLASSDLNILTKKKF